MSVSHKASNPFYRSRPWRAFRLTILARDGYACVNCGAFVFGKGEARVDHIKRIEDGGAMLDPSNCRTLCAECDNQSHREKGSGSAERQERFKIRGAQSDGTPADPNHPWHRTTPIGV